MIIIKNLLIPTHIGVPIKERRSLQSIRVSIALATDHHLASMTDAISETVSYSMVRNDVITLVKRSRFRLIETLGETIADHCLGYPGVREARVMIEKPQHYRDTQSVGVEYVKVKSFVRSLAAHAKLRNLPTVAIIGVVNVTPDSFSDGGLHYDAKNAVDHALKLEREGASLIDVGGESTRPGAKFVSEKEELRRILPVIRLLRKSLKKATLLSVDTWKSGVAREVLNAGATIINSLGGFQFDPKLATVVARANAPVMMYHTYGRPATITKHIKERRDVVNDLLLFFRRQMSIGRNVGIKPQQYVLDPGIGFGKTVGQNIDIVRRLNELMVFGLPIGVSCSRKGHLGVLLKRALHLKDVPGPTERMEAGLAETALAVLSGATIIRAHDVVQTKRFVTVLNALRV